MNRCTKMMRSVLACFFAVILALYGPVVFAPVSTQVSALSEYDTLKKEQEELEKEQQALKEQQEALKQQIAQMGSSIEAQQAKVDALKKQIANMEEQINTCARQLEWLDSMIAGKDEAWLRALLAAQGIEQTKRVLIALLNTQGTLLVQEKGENGRLLNVPVMKPEEVAW